ncbi:hydroxymethylglutaryl-CoA reductase, degradative [Oligoflexus tunisiensis]|uniref:hydroxymethylglutaryl-CoA reductase, degradative n=1 Tax=Oligoflexus tunisiensis TaxID=708132 RepID=UPI000B24FBF3|nr:hydroxymethylglutaryl-CoA reductase, degradative [Oligoflexus tunisiensis]
MTSPKPAFPLDNAPDQDDKLSSRIPGFHNLPIEERRGIILRAMRMETDAGLNIGGFGDLSAELINVFIENGVGTYSLPLGIATNFTINGEDVLIPMAVEETSVVAAASHGAKMIRAGGGFRTSSTDPIGTGQIQLYPDPGVDFHSLLERERGELLAWANQGQDRLLARGGGARNLSWRFIEPLQSLVIHIDVDTRDAMGANLINTVCERLARNIQQLIPCRMGLRILTNLCDKRIAKAHCKVPKDSLGYGDYSGPDVVERIEKAYLFAAHDIYRAATHNKGVMNGIDPVVIATGNDWRAAEAGAHAYACRNGIYQPMTRWWKNEEGDLEGEIELPMALGTVGGVTTLHPGSKAALRLLGNPCAQRLAEIVVAVGLGQNLSALRALTCEGIQSGHMRLHQGNLELSAGQKP